MTITGKVQKYRMRMASRPRWAARRTDTAATGWRRSWSQCLPEAATPQAHSTANNDYQREVASEIHFPVDTICGSKWNTTSRDPSGTITPRNA